MDSGAGPQVTCFFPCALHIMGTNRTLVSEEVTELAEQEGEALPFLTFQAQAHQTTSKAQKSWLSTHALWSTKTQGHRWSWQKGTGNSSCLWSQRKSATAGLDTSNAQSLPHKAA